MVRSNFASGVGRSVLCESLESRQFFSITIGPDPAFAGGLATVSFGGTGGTAYRVGVLKDGRVLVAGTANLPGDSSTFRAALALFNPNGTLATGFDGDGKLLLPTSFGTEALDVMPLPDGGALVLTSPGLVKIKANGTVDTAFGVNGLLAKQEKPFVTPTGTIETLSHEYGSALGFNSYDAAGKKLTESPTVNIGYDIPNRLPDGRVWVSGYNQKISLYTSAGKKVKTFGSYGDAFLEGPLKSWLTGRKPWTPAPGTTLKNGLPLVSVQRMVPTRDGGFLVEIAAFGKTASAPVKTTDNGSFYTPIAVALDANGKFLSINSGTAHRVGIDFDGGDASFKFGDGEDATFTAFRRQGEFVGGLARAGNGAFYVAGQARNTSGTSQFSVARTPVLAGRISGTLFSDDNGNGRRDGSEVIVPGRTVYLDDNHDGKLDNNEIFVVTDSAGKYAFSDLGPGKYDVKRVLPSGYHVTTSTAGVKLTLGQSSVFDIGSNNRPQTVAKSVLA